jgi:hypothetical protein
MRRIGWWSSVPVRVWLNPVDGLEEGNLFDIAPDHLGHDAKFSLLLFRRLEPEGYQSVRNFGFFPRDSALVTPEPGLLHEFAGSALIRLAAERAVGNAENCPMSVRRIEASLPSIIENNILACLRVKSSSYVSSFVGMRVRKALDGHNLLHRRIRNI